jgi:hypothetical protein
MNSDFFIKQLEEIISDFNGIKTKALYDDLSGGADIEEIMAVLSKAKAAVARIVGDDSEYYKDIVSAIAQTHLYEGERLKKVIGAIQALKSDLVNGYLKSFSAIVQSEVFSDYLEMAEHLLKEGYKDPSAVLTGTTLEVHLRDLCLANSIPIETTNAKGNLIPKKADLMNAELTKAKIYSPAYQKQIIAWLGIRNSAAHGKYSEYSNEEIALMLQGIRQFILTTT